MRGWRASACGAGWPLHRSLEAIMTPSSELSCTPTAIRTDLGAIFVSLELSRATWRIASLSPGAGERMSRHSVRGGDLAGPLGRFAALRARALARTGALFAAGPHSGGRPGRLLAAPRARAGGHREPCRRRRLGRHIATQEAGRDRPDLWRGARAHAAGLQARRAAGPRHGARARPRRGGSPAVVPRAQDPRRRAGPSRQPRPRRAVRPRRRRPRPAPPRPAGPARGAADGGRPASRGTRRR